MRIKSLQINGFKSFVDRTVLAFGSGVTAIVGPNGCGKSNVVDAMRWAMGEQSPRRLRGKGMDDVIFAGSDARAAVGMAEVVLTFDNRDGRAPAAFSGFTEIQVTRRLFRTGESEYEINKTACRMRDVLDFFRDTGIGTRGYTIVEQGQIAAIVSAKPEDRRQLIEEAAGISKYKARRREAERKLEATQQNLTRVSDVLGEIRRQIASLERQARKAVRYRRFLERQRLLDLSIAAEERHALAQRLVRAEHELAQQRSRVAEAEARLAEREADLERKRLDLADEERGVVGESEALFALRGEIKALENRIEYERREREQLIASQEQRRGELARLGEQRAEAAADRRAGGEELARLEVEIAREEQALAGLEDETKRGAEALRDLEAQREALNAQVVETLTEVARAEDRHGQLEERNAGLAHRLRNTDEALEVQQGEASRAGREQHQLEEGLRNLLIERDRLMHALREALSRHDAAERTARAAAERAREARERRDLRSARLASLREVIERAEDLDEGTRYLLEQWDAVCQRHGLRAVVRDVLEVDAEMERAVEAVLRERAGAVAVADLGGALSAVEALRESRRGGAVFVAEPSDLSPDGGFVPLGEPLLARVRVRAGFENVARALLGGVYLVSDLSEALKVYGGGRLPATFVTPLGDVLTPDGVLRGGGSIRPGVLARMREVRELEVEVANLMQGCEALEGKQATHESELARAADELDNLRNRHHTAALAVASHEKDLERTRERVKALGEAQEGRSAERSQLVSEAESLERDARELASRLVAGRANRDRLQRELDALSTKIGEAFREQQRLEARLTERRVTSRGRLERRDQLTQAQSRAAQLLSETETWIEQREREIAESASRSRQLEDALREAERALADMLERETEARERSERARDHYEELAADIRGQEEALRGLRSQLQAEGERAQALELEVSESSMRCEQLDDRVRDRWRIELATWSPPLAEPVMAAEPATRADVEDDADAFDARDAELLAQPLAERRAALDEVRRRLESLGEVNLGAIEEHEELGERFRFLSEQKDDLEHTVTSLREAIARINRTSRRRFRETFDAVNERFQKNFPRLFRGGRASLSLAESEDVLEAGIEILAQPPGKRLQNVTLLSGGEKTLTACALLVSLFQVQPSPFFLLDEVDAALDDANVGRLNDIIREMADESQFLVITHNKATIETADEMYGVTMEERGVSKIVSVELREASSAATPPSAQ